MSARAASLAGVPPTSTPPPDDDRGARRGRGSLREQLLAWYHATGRDLPWRRACEPYAVLVSEVMLQQTQAARVAEAWPRFLARFPDVASLASAPTSHVIHEWRGLGYNRRAVSLQRAAQAIVELNGGAVPSALADLQALPGVGPYTARAVAVFAFGEPVAPVDTNVARVLSRAVAGRALPPKDMQELADALVPAEAPASWSHALMDLGARVCTARAPRCEACPLVETCVWRSADHVPADPAVGRSQGGQGRFEGSDRWHRGRLVEALRQGAIESDRLGWAAGLEGDAPRLERLVAGLVADGLARWAGSALVLPGPDQV